MSISVLKAWWASFDRWLNSPSGRRALMSIFLLIAFVFSILPVLRCMRGQSTIDYKGWYDAGRHVLAGEEIYVRRAREYDFIYPPACALFLAVPSILFRCGFILVLVVINSFAWFLSARFAAQLAAGNGTERNGWLYFVPSFCVMQPIWSNYHLGQPSLVLLALMLGAFVSLRARHEILAGALIALAAATKAFPVVAIVYLIYRHYWKAAASLALTLIVVLLVLPAPFRGGFERTWQDLAKWSAGMLKYDAHGVGERRGHSQSWKNQSIVGVANRLLRHIDIDDTTPPDQPVYVNVVETKFSTTNGVIAVVSLVLGILFLAAMPAKNMRTAETDAIEFALLVLMILMLTPLSSSYLFAWLILPFAVITQQALDRKRISWWVVAAAVVFLFVFISPRLAQAYGNLFFGALILFLGFTVELWRRKRQLHAQAGSVTEA